MIDKNGIVLIHISLFMNEAEVYGLNLIGPFEFLLDCARWALIILCNMESFGGYSEGRILQLCLQLCLDVNINTAQRMCLSVFHYFP